MASKTNAKAKAQPALKKFQPTPSTRSIGKSEPRPDVVSSAAGTITCMLNEGYEIQQRTFTLISQIDELLMRIAGEEDIKDKDKDEVYPEPKSIVDTLYFLNIRGVVVNDKLTSIVNMLEKNL